MTEHSDKRLATYSRLINKRELQSQLKGAKVPDYNAESYTKFASNLYQEAIGVFSVANREYSSDNIWTSNFDYAALMMRMSGIDNFQPRQAAMVYLMKSIFSIGRDNSERQSMRSRYVDAINYLSFMAWMDENNHDVAMAYPGE
jgi:hypothetical protein